MIAALPGKQPIFLKKGLQFQSFPAMKTIGNGVCPLARGEKSA
jgi:hypothetical protein